MAKSLALTDRVEIDGSDLSEFARAVNPTSEHTEVDVSGFNSTGKDETLPGNIAESVEVEFFWCPEVHDVLYPAHRDRTIVTFEWNPDQNSGTSSDNPLLSGNVYVNTYSPSHTRGEGRPFTVLFKPADEAGLVYSAT